MSLKIGRLEPRPFGFRAFCRHEGCSWYQDLNDPASRKGDPIEGEKRLRRHYAVAHPPTIDMYLEDE